MFKSALVTAILLMLCAGLGGQEPQSAQPQQDSTQKSKQKQTDKQKDQPKSDEANKPKPLFGGSVGASSSQQKKDTTSMGFNGLDPQGKVEKAMMDASPTAADEQKVDKLASTTTSNDDLKKFLQDGNLKPSPKVGGGQ